MEHSSLKKEGEGGEPGKRGMFGGFIMSVREIYRVMREYPKVCSISNYSDSVHF